MENVVLTIHLILAVLLTGVVLVQRSEGGGLGVGSGGGNGIMSGRQAANAMTRLTWIFGVALFVTSMALTVIAARQSATSSIMDQLGVPPVQQSAPGAPAVPTYTPPPTTGGDPLTPPAPAAESTPATTAPAAEPVAPPAAEAPAQSPSQAPATDAAVPPAPAEPAVSGN